MKGTDLLPRLSRGTFLGAIVSALFWLFWPQVSSLHAPIASFLVCAIVSIVLGVKARATVPGKTGLIGSIVLVVLVVGLNVALAVLHLNKREMLKERTLNLESSLQELARKTEQRTVQPAPRPVP
ncbi:MAG: hypothetical protein PHR35_16575 [Kiritimatiellae bacterium]|nr:hypothetical protein [Kiritimatiellia bacterium]